MPGNKGCGEFYVTDSELLEIRQAFAVESAELLTEMESALLALGNNAGSEDDFGRLFRAIHTIKGSASIVGFEAIEHFCHGIENILVPIREHELSLDQQLVALLLKCHDHILLMMGQHCVSGESKEIFAPSAKHKILLDQLQQWAAYPASGQGEQLKYGMLDESCLGNDAESAGSGFNLFEDVDDLQLHCEQPPGGVSVDTALPSEAVAGKQHSVRVDAVRLDQLANLVIELVTASSVLEAHVRRLGDHGAVESVTHVADLVKQMQEKTMSFRMVPVQSLFMRFQRVIHDIGSATGKRIKLLVSGGETELDKVVADKLHDPLLHLVRNAIDHGIEMADGRALHGKPPIGTIHLQAFHDSGNIVIRVTDDGQGINLESVANKAVERGLAKRETLPAGAGLLSYIFEPGFSTLEDATMLSGRGVGMDVVRKVVESIRGRIDVETDAGIGTTFQISIPLSLSLVDGFMLSLGSNLYIMPMDLVLETMELPGAERRVDMPNGCLQVRDQLLPCLDLRKILGVVEPSPAIQHVVVFKNGGTGVGLVVDRLHGEIKTVIKPLGRIFRNATCVSGASILGDGSIALLLETGKLIETSREQHRL